MNEKQKANAVLVAQDVLKQLHRKSVPLKVNKGCYFRILADYRNYALPQGELQNYVDVVQERCEVCARGAMVLSKARLLNDVLVDRVIRMDQDATANLLKDVWDEKQLDLMEAAFEVCSNYYEEHSKGLAYGAVCFGAKFPDARKRLAAIMKNVVENAGVFVVEKATEDEMYEAIDSQNSFM